MKVLLWLDDYRDPFDSEADWILQAPSAFVEKIVWVKSYEEFTEWIIEHGLPVSISFDHDLADSHYTPQHLWNYYAGSKAWQEAQTHREKTGYDCAIWLVNYCLDFKRQLPIYGCHSANPVGRDNILKLLNNFKDAQIKARQDP